MFGVANSCCPHLNSAFLISKSGDILLYNFPLWQPVCLSAHLLCHIITFSFPTPVSSWCFKYGINLFPQPRELWGAPCRDLMCCCDKPGYFLTWTHCSRYKTPEFSWQTPPSWVHDLINYQGFHFFWALSLACYCPLLWAELCPSRMHMLKP